MSKRIGMPQNAANEMATGMGPGAVAGIVAALIAIKEVAFRAFRYIRGRHEQKDLEEKFDEIKSAIQENHKTITTKMDENSVMLTGKIDKCNEDIGELKVGVAKVGTKVDNHDSHLQNLTDDLRIMKGNN